MPGRSISDKAQRSDAYLPEATDEEFVAQLNERLRETPAAGTAPERPLIFVVGAPRSGTTFLAQTLCRYFRVDYVDNLAAKFWRAPATGMRLAKLLFGDEKGGNFKSDYGRTSGADIHGFHYFWIEQLRLDSTASLFRSPAERQVDPAVINGHLAAMQNVSGLPLVLKGYYPGYFMRWFAENVRSSVFVLVVRDPMDEARSIYRARQTYMRSVDEWWSMFPPEYERLLELPAEEQIAGQIYGLRSFYDRQLAATPLPVVRVEYERLIADPEAELRRVHSELAQCCKGPVESTGLLPEVRPSGGGPLAGVDERLQRALNRYREEGSSP